MSFEERNRQTAAAWAQQIVEHGLVWTLRRPLKLPRSVSPFRFFALSEWVPVNHVSWECVVADQRRLAAHAIIMALRKIGRHAYLAEQSDETAHGFTSIALPGVTVDVGYANYDGFEYENHSYRVHFDLHLHVSRNPIRSLKPQTRKGSSWLAQLQNSCSNLS